MDLHNCEVHYSEHPFQFGEHNLLAKTYWEQCYRLDRRRFNYHTLSNIVFLRIMFHFQDRTEIIAVTTYNCLKLILWLFHNR